MTRAARTRDNRGLAAERQGHAFLHSATDRPVCCRCLRRNAHQHVAVKKTHHLTRKVRIATKHSRPHWGHDPVPVKNSIRPPVTEFGRHGHTLAGKVGAQPSFLTIGSRDDPRPRCLGLRPRPSRQFCRSHTRKRRPASSTGGATAISRSPPAPSVGPPRLDRALTAVGGLAVHPRHRSARDRPRLAPPGLPTLLALEVPAPHSGSPAGRS